MKSLDVAPQRKVVGVSRTATPYEVVLSLCHHVVDRFSYVFRLDADSPRGQPLKWRAGMVAGLLLGFSLCRTFGGPQPAGWYSGDMHVHTSCGGTPENITNIYNEMIAQDVHVVSLLADMGNGEVLDPTNDLPKVNGLDAPVSTANRIIHWDAEWHWDSTYLEYPHQALGGHVVALGLTNAYQIWKEYTYPIFDWAHTQGGIAGFAHLQFLPAESFPSTLDCCTPLEYPVEVALGECDFISEDGAGSESAIAAYYRLLNCGFRPGWAAGSDWPCLVGVGETRTYVKVDGALTYDKWISGMAAGQTVVSRNGDMEFLDLKVNTNSIPGDEVFLVGPGSVQVSVDWLVDQALSGDLEILKNGVVVASKSASAWQGSPDNLSATITFTNSGWLAARRMSGAGHEAHTGAIYVTVDAQPVRASVSDALFYVDWMDELLTRTASNGVWTSYFITNRAEAHVRYQAARSLYQQIADEAAALLPLGVVTAVLPAAVTQSPYLTSIAAIGGTAPYLWSITDGALPTGLLLDTNSGVIDGTPSVDGVSNFIVQVTDSSTPTQTATQLLTISVVDAISNAGIMGNTNNGSVNDPIWFNGAWINAGRHLAGSNMTVAAIHAQVKGISGKYKCAIYTDNGGLPDRLIASTAEVMNPDTGWEAFPLSAIVSLTDGSYYWLAIWSDDANAAVYYSDASGTLSWLQYGYGDWPDPLSTSGGGSFNYCIYASGFPSAFPDPLAVVFKSPADGAMDVLPGTTVEATFNRLMNSATITSNTVQLFDADTNHVPASVVYDALAFSAVLTPNVQLSATSGYTATVVGGAGGVSDLFGLTLSNDVSWSFSIAAPDTTPPKVRSTYPDSDLVGANIAGELRVVFSERMNPGTIHSNTIYLWDNTNGLVPSTVSYNSATRTASLVPGALLDTNAVYTATVMGGGSGVQDVAGNGMASDYTWNFTTVSGDPYGTGPGGPVIVLSSSTNGFSTYYAEILLAEGYNTFEIRDISTVSNQMLQSFDVAILGEGTLSSAQVGMLSNWVTDGGNLIAMRPDKQLAGLLGVADVGGTLAEGYISVTTTAAPGRGITEETMQYHGVADLYTTTGADVVAALYTNANTASAFPAVTLRNVGTNGGQAAAFTYDLARSIVLTRQGNPAWIDQDRDGTGYVRSDDLFFGNAVFDPQPDWVNTSKLGIPQADEQQRLLMNLIVEMNADRLPLPHFWYFPDGHRAAIVMTGDDHAHAYTDNRFDQYLAYSPTNASVAEWEAIRGSSYIYFNTPLTDGQAAQYVADGFEIGLHVNTACAGYTSASLDSTFATQLSAFSANFPSLPTPTTHRMHCIAWSGYTIMPEIEFKYGIRFDVNYYHYPPSWIGSIPGFMTGSGMPMRFCTLTGDVLDVYQAATQMTDESGQTYPDVVDFLLDRALGPKGYYGAFVANIHTDFSSTDFESDAIILSSFDRGVPVVSAKQMFEWVDGRNNSSITDLSWTNSVLSFSVAANSSAFGLQAMVPVQAGYAVGSVSSNGNPAAYQLRHVKGVQYVQVSVGDGAFEVSFTPDSQGPSVVMTSPGNAATQVSINDALSVVFDEAIDPASVNTNTLKLIDSLSNAVEVTVSYNSYTLEAILTPVSPLLEVQTYTATVVGGGSGLKDLAGNAMDGDHQWAFTTTGIPFATIWPASATPDVITDPDAVPIELGVKFQSDRDGYIMGIRFYKGPFNTGTHLGNLWTGGGANLASVTFSSETASGWQQQLFASPVPILSNITYVVSYHAPNGRYSISENYFASSGYDNPPLRALAHGEDGGNGVFKYGASGFPTTAFTNNYWVDTLFSEIISSNTAPMFVVTPADVAIPELSLFSVTNSATDGDVPAQALNYTLLTAPTNAAIDANGVISWTPLESQGPSTNSFVTEVSDGVVSVTNGFVVTVTETNAAPVFDGTPIDVEMVELTLLSVTNSASDADVPNQTLSYTLLTAPTNATIDTNGLITWTPPEGQGPSTNTFITSVSDGLASVTNSFAAVVLAPLESPVILSISLTNGVVTVICSTVSDQSYELQYLATPSTTNWLSASSSVPATNSTVTLTNEVGTDVMRLYRVKSDRAH